MYSKILYGGVLVCTVQSLLFYIHPTIPPIPWMLWPRQFSDTPNSPINPKACCPPSHFLTVIRSITQPEGGILWAHTREREEKREQEDCRSHPNTGIGKYTQRRGLEGTHQELGVFQCFMRVKQFATDLLCALFLP